MNGYKLSVLFTLILILFLCGRDISFEKKIGHYRIKGQYTDAHDRRDTFMWIDPSNLEQMVTISISRGRTGRWEYFSDDSGLCAYTIYRPDSFRSVDIHYLPDSIRDYTEVDSTRTYMTY